MTDKELDDDKILEVAELLLANPMHPMDGLSDNKLFRVGEALAHLKRLKADDEAAELERAKARKPP